MELDELKSRWEEHDRKLDACVRLNQRLLRESVLDKADTALRRLSRLLWFELLLNLGAALMLGSFIADHVQEPRFLVPALGLQLCAMGLVIGAIRQLAAITQIDYAAPIVAIQKRLESLRAERIRTTQWTLLLAPLAWTPLFIVAMKGFLGVDVYATFDRTWLVANVLFGLAVIVAAVWVSRSYGNRLEGSPLIQRLLRDLGGQNLAAARAFVDSLSQFADSSPVDRTGEPNRRPV